MGNIINCQKVLGGIHLGEKGVLKQFLNDLHNWIKVFDKSKPLIPKLRYLRKRISDPNDLPNVMNTVIGIQPLVYVKMVEQHRTHMSARGQCVLSKQIPRLMVK